MSTLKRLKRHDYTVAWLCALALSEQVAAVGMLDERHESLPQPADDKNTYIYGSIKDHNIIIACLPLGQPGTISASRLVEPLPKSFPNLRIHLLVGIGGGIPHDPPSMDPEKDIHLGDVVVGVAEKPGVAGVVQYDFERDHGAGNRELLGSLDKPDRQLVMALGTLFTLYLSGTSNFNLHLERLKGLKMDFTRPMIHEDKLYKSSYGHVDGSPSDCGSCPGDGLILRSERLSPDPVVHQGQILSGNAVIKNTLRRDELSLRFPDARCFEMEAAGIMDQTKCLVIRGIADYADSHKNQHWQPYAAATAAAFAREFLVIIRPHEVTDIDPIASSQTCTQKYPLNPAAFTPDEKACLQSLHFTEMHWRRNGVVDPTPSTCAWLLEHPEYREWLRQGHGMLWIKGKPGAGKSTVLKHALETAERETTERIILASFFFHGRGAPMQKNVLGLFRSLLHQILQKDRDLLLKLTSLYKGSSETEGEFGKKWNWHEKQLQGFFKHNVGDAARRHQIRIYIDALDECGEDLATEVVEFFRFFAAPISICFSCRHYPFVALEGGNEVCVEQENEQDIERYITDKINTHVQRVGTAQVIRNEMVSRSKGNFQWVVLVLPRVLKLHKSRKSLLTIQTMIQSIPAELNELYTTLLDFVDEYERAQSLRLLQWISFAIRPLTLRELRYALAVSAETPHSSLRLCETSGLFVDTDEDMMVRVCDLSKGLAEVSTSRSSRIVQFVHQSVKDFLLEQGFQILDHASAGTVVGRGHFWLSRSCVKYFLMEEVRDFAISTQDNVDELRRIKESFPMLVYSLHYLFQHIQYVDVANMSQDDLVPLDSEATDGILQRSWFDVYQRHRSYRYGDLNGGTLLHAASAYNVIGIVKAILARNVWADPKDNYSQTPLFIAARDGHNVVVDMLMNREDVDVNSEDESGDTPLSIAAAGKHEAIVEMLMTRDDVDLNSRHNSGDTPLFLAAERGREAIVKMLVNRNGVDVNARDNLGRTPFFSAAYNCHHGVMKLLLQQDVDVNARDDLGRTPFFSAAYNCHHGVMKLLLQQDVDVNARDDLGRTPFFSAAYNCHHGVMKLLLQQDVDVNARDIEGRTPLSYAASDGHYKTLELLLQHNADVDSKDIEGRTPLSYAASRGRVAVVKLLLKGASNADQKDEDGRTPFSYAVCCGVMEVAQAFLERRDIHINSKDNDGRSPLSWALLDADPWACHVAEYLLEQNDVIVTEEDRDAMEQTPYFREYLKATQNGREPI